MNLSIVWTMNQIKRVNSVVIYDAKDQKRVVRKLHNSQKNYFRDVGAKNMIIIMSCYYG